MPKNLAAEYVEKIKGYGLGVIYSEEMDMKPWEERVIPGMIAFLEKIPAAIEWLEPIRGTK